PSREGSPAAARAAPSPLAPADRGVLAAAAPSARLRPCLQLAACGLLSHGAGRGERLREQLGDLGALEDVRRDAVELEAAVTVEHTARAQVAAGERLIETADDVEAEQLLRGAHVQRHLQLAVADPTRGRRRVSALVVVHDRLSALAHVDAI